MKWARQAGFTIVELLIVIVVIAILASITVVAYNGIQQRARDSRRAQDIAVIQKALNIHNSLNSGVPATTTYAGNDTGGWDSSATTPWISFLTSQNGGPAPVDPLNTGTGDPSISGQAYFYYCYSTTSGFDGSGNPHAVFGYWTEINRVRKTTIMTVERCI